MRKQYRAGLVLAVGVLCAMLLCGCPLSAQMGQKISAGFAAVEFAESQLIHEASRETAGQEAYAGEGAAGRQQKQRISDGNLAYEGLSAEGKIVYDQMLGAILSYEKSVKLATADQQLMRTVYQALNCDYGSLFWVDGYVFTSFTKGGKVIGLEFSPIYVMEEQEKRSLQKQVDQTVEEWLAGVSLRDSDYEKAKYVFETLVERVDYVEGAKDNQNILSVFLHQQTVCQGYACAAQYLLRQLGISSTIVSGKANNQSHAWNLVKLDGAYYHMDVTWGNSTYLNTEQKEAKFVNYNFLCMTDEEISHTHRAEMNFSLPACDQMANNYYVKEGRYFESWDPERIGAVFRDAWEQGLYSVDIKCKDDALYEQLKEYFVRQQKISDYCAGIAYVYYMEAPEYRVFTVNFQEM